MTEPTDERVDLRALDPTADAARFDDAVTAVMDRAALELARRRREATALGQIARWRRPMLAAAALAAIATYAVIASNPADSGGPGTLAEAIGIPTEVAQWVRGETAPTPTDLLFVTGGQ